MTPPARWSTPAVGVSSPRKPSRAMTGTERPLSTVALGISPWAATSTTASTAWLSWCSRAAATLEPVTSQSRSRVMPYPASRAAWATLETVLAGP